MAHLRLASFVKAAPQVLHMLVLTPTLDAIWTEVLVSCQPPS